MMMRATIILVCLSIVLGCGKKEPVQPAKPNAEATKPEMEGEGGYVVAQPTTPDTKATKPEPPKSTPKPEPKPGTALWEFETGGDVFSSPAIGSDGTVYVRSRDNKLYALNGKSGVKLWKFETEDAVFSSPAIGSDGTVYVGSRDNKLYAIKTDSKDLAKSPWPMRGQNPQRTGRAPTK